MKPTRTTPSTICAWCSKEVRLRPAGGDWCNDLYPRRHNDATGERCPGSWHAVENKAIIERYREVKS